MIHSKRNRRNRQSAHNVAISAIAEMVEPRMLLSAAPVLPPVAAPGVNDAVGTKELVIVADTYGTGGSANPKIDEIRLVGDEVQVFSTTYNQRTWPGEYYLLHYSAVGTPNLVMSSYLAQLKSDPITVTVPDRELNVVYFFANIDQPQSDLYDLRTFGTSTQLYRRADADGDSGWLTTDVDPGAGSTVGLDFTPTPAAPTGLITTSASATSNEVTLWFDESPASAFAGQRFVRQYNISIQSSRVAFFAPLSTGLVTFDSQRFSMTDASGSVKTFGGMKTFILPADVYSWSVQVRDLPVFPDGTTGTNALATPWSEFSETVRFSVLPQGQQILLGRTFADSSTGIATIEWGSVADAASYEVWINRVSDGAMVLHKTGLSGSSYQTDALDPDNYRVWVRATRANDTRTSWSQFEAFTVDPPYVNAKVANSFASFTPVHDATPTITWTAVPHSTQYKITLIDMAMEQQANTIDFATGQDYDNFITAYSRTVRGNGSSHTIATPLAAGNYRIEITLSYSNGSTSQGNGYLNLEPAGVPIPAPGMDSLIRWTAEDDVLSYDVWVAYLGRPGATINVAPPKWNFATQDGVTSGSYQLPADAPAGNYRIWLRPNKASSLQTTAKWNAPVDFTSHGPLYRAVSVTVQGEKLTWEPVSGATGYQVDFYGPFQTTGVSSLRRFVTTGTEFQIPDEMIDGAYNVFVQSLDSNAQIHSPSAPIPVQHGTSSWTWNISNDPSTVSWIAIPDAISYDVKMIDRGTGNTFLELNDFAHTRTPVIDPIGGHGIAGHYTFQIRALRSVNGHEFKTKWESKNIDLGVAAPSNIQLNGTTLTWDGQADATYSVTVAVQSGRLDATNQIFPAGDMRILPYPWYNNFPVQSTTFEVSGKIVDLQLYITALYSYAPTATFVVSVTAKVQNPGGTAGDELTATSGPVEFTLPQKALWTDPIIEIGPQPKPSTPNLLSPSGNTLIIPPVGGLPSDDASTHIYRTQNRAAIDLEYVRRYQLRVTDLQTGIVRSFDDSQIPELLQLQDVYESPVLNYSYPYYGQITTIGSPISLTPDGSAISLTTQLGLSSSVYKIEARVQYLPVILSASTSDPYKFSLTDTQPDYLNVAATPWSDWSIPLEYTVLPDGQNVLPIANTAGTISSRPTFAWGSNTPNAQYELWVENRATKQRVLHETLTDVHRFQSTTNLPPGQYDWWVRIVGTTGTRNGWSFKQSLDVYAPALSTSVVTETADATPVVSWTAVTGAQSYVVTLTSTATGKVVYTANAAANTTSHRVATTLPNDTYTVSIQALLPNGARTAPGVVDSGGGFVLKRMVVGAAPKNVVFTSSRVSWQTATDATKYDVWINYVSPAGKTERIFRQDAFGTDIHLPANLPSRAGEYRVWIRAIRSEAGQDYVGRWSEVKTLTVGPSPASLNASALTLVMSDLATTGLQL